MEIDEIVLKKQIDYAIHAAAITVLKMMVENPADTIMASVNGMKKVHNLAVEQ